MKKRRRKKFKLFLMLFMLFCGLAMFQNYFQQAGSLQLEKSDPFADVKKYRPLIHDELAKYNLETHTTVLVALMQQESRGKGGDPMQSSESAGLARNTITDPKKSIQVGVKHFQRVLTYGNQKKVDFQAIIQSYNMGIGYIDYVAQHGGKHSEALAKEFSLQRVKEKPAIYTCGGNKDNFRYPYCYGDFTYSTKVTNNIQLLADTVPVNGTEKTTSGSF
ncbi:lysozyme family protein [Bacillus sp. ISL-40]|uniref:lysozyme family protein n=1 Tax=unclassified Bacillus (in: firmicutes) TaxID=185979 RepID=UPI001BE51219|nr:MULTISPECIES: lysozyme family protein [unclassified Bacillus (in: firmicutes)]MBT2696070.1 lysozyme family protein [Bacillus sp. ISL-40]MBT2723256.1 lysozyme family protein [Bacillus sp. ISL-46]MBT2744378.1 lysozyme family protein [Bacillus sp. ISL-77]